MEGEFCDDLLVVEFAVAVVVERLAVLVTPPFAKCQNATVNLRR